MISSLTKSNRNADWLRYVIILVAFLIISGFLVSQALNKKINHDEDQYIACAQLINDGYVPYKDFYYHHLPYLPYIYAGIFSFTNHLILSARLFSVLCILIYLFLIFLLVSKNFGKLSKNKILAFSLSALFLIISTQVFRYSATLSWAHDFPIMLIVLAFYLFDQFFRNEQKILLLFIGILIGISVMAKLSYIYAIMPFFLILLVGFGKIPFKQIAIRILILTSGFILSLLPLLILISPKETFDIFIYSIYNFHFKFDPIFLKEVGYLLSPQQKLNLYFQSFLNKQLLLPVISLIVSGFFMFYQRKQITKHRDLFLAVLIVLFSFLGVVTKEVLLEQYFYIIIVFLILSFYLTLSKFELLKSRNYSLVFGIIIFVILAWDSFYITHAFGNLNTKYLQEIHSNGLKIKQIVKDEKVVSLSPLYCLEGGCKIYPEFANGVFSWRVGSCENVQDTNFTSIKNFNSFYQKYKPKYLYTGHEKKFEQNLIDFFEQKGFVPVEIDGQGFLFITEN